MNALDLSLPPVFGTPRAMPGAPVMIARVQVRLPLFDAMLVSSELAQHLRPSDDVP